MAIRLRKFSTNLLIKVLVFVLLLVSVLTGMESLVSLVRSSREQGDIINEYLGDFENSNNLSRDLNDYAQLFYRLNSVFPSDQAIADGTFITTNLIIEEMSKKFSNWSDILKDDFRIDYDETNQTYQIIFLIDFEDKAVQEEKEALFKTFISEVFSEQQVKNILIKRYSKQKSQIREALNQYSNFEMTIIPKSKINDDTKINTLTKTFEKYPIYYIQKSGIPESNNSYLRRNLLFEGDDYYFVGINQSKYRVAQTNWNSERKHVIQTIVKLAVSFLAAVICFAFLCTVAGKRSDSDEINIGRADKIWSEIQFVVMAVSLYMIVYNYAIGSIYLYQKYIIVTAAWALLFQMLLLQIKRIRMRQFLNGFITVRFLKTIKRGLLALWYGGPRMARAMVLVVLVPLVSKTAAGAFILVPILMFLTYRYVKSLEAVLDGVKKVKEGQLDYRIEVLQKGDLKELADDINSISEGLKNAVASEVKSERLKSELLSNVSHDIKTPLTSIITYIHLLKGEKITNQVANEYIEIIDRKSQRLKILTTDLFEAAKATSGDMPVNMKPVDFNEFIMQGIGEFEDRIENAGLEVRISLVNEPVVVLADGNLLWRIFQNIMSNVIKYAMQNSRVYLELTSSDKYAMLEVKNISAHELNIPAEELMERFQRGDKSRTTEGSGLGLSIARSLIELQNGFFEIDIDGDLFKVKIQLERSINEV